MHDNYHLPAGLASELKRNIRLHAEARMMMYAMAASQRSLVPLLMLCLLCGGTCVAAAKRRYVSINMDDLLSSKAHVDCPPTEKSVTTSSGNKVTIIPAACGLPPKCCGRGDVLDHDMDRLTTLLRRSSVVSKSAFPAAAPPSAIARIPLPTSSPPVPPPAEAPSVTIPDSSGMYLNTPEFVVTIGFGTPARPSTVILDTGSDLSWIQCRQPCSGGHCYHQQNHPIFDPSKSSTYAAVPCGDPQCTDAGGRCNGSTCLFNVKYDDGDMSSSTTSGVLSRETLTLTSSRALPGFVFGCAEQQNTTDSSSFGEADGVIGLGRGGLSLASQAAASFGATFSYCLPSYNSTPGYLTIGGSTPPASSSSSNKVLYTAMIQKQEYPSLYFVELVSIDIGGYVLPVPPTVFTSTGTLLDSGTVLTYLPAEAYTALRDRFRFTMQGYKPAPPPIGGILDTCYDFTGQSAIVMPAIFFKFSDGTVLDLNPSGIMTLFLEQQTAIGCLAFAARPSMMPFTIFGNIQQRSTGVIYDVAAGKIGFVWGAC